MRSAGSDPRGLTFERSLRPLSTRSINMTVTLLGAVLEAAIDDDELGPQMPRNGARGRRVKQRAPQRTHLDSAEQIEALSTPLASWIAPLRATAGTCRGAR